MTRNEIFIFSDRLIPGKMIRRVERSSDNSTRYNCRGAHIIIIIIIIWNRNGFPNDIDEGVPFVVHDWLTLAALGVELTPGRYRKRPRIYVNQT